MGGIGQGVKRLIGVDYSDGYSFTLSVVGVEVCATFPAVYLPQGSRASRNTAERGVSAALEAKPEVEIWRRPVFLTQRPRLPIRLRIHYGIYLAPLRLHRRGILTLAHFNGRLWKVRYSVFSNFEQNLLESWSCDFV